MGRRADSIPCAFPFPAEEATVSTNSPPPPRPRAIRSRFHDTIKRCRINTAITCQFVLSFMHPQLHGSVLRERNRGTCTSSLGQCPVWHLEQRCTLSGMKLLQSGDPEMGAREGTFSSGQEAKRAQRRQGARGPSAAPRDTRVNTWSGRRKEKHSIPFGLPESLAQPPASLGTALHHAPGIADGTGRRRGWAGSAQRVPSLRGFESNSAGASMSAK